MARREVVKYGQLQKKVMIRKGTLRRKKVAMYEESLWVALCIHDEKIPLLEWYRTEDKVKEHIPVKVVDLLFASYVTPVIKDDKCFVIGFKTEDEPIELSAISWRERQDWSTAVHDTLIRLGVLQNKSNVYGDCVKKRDPLTTVSLLDSPLSPTLISPPVTPPRLDDAIPLSDGQNLNEFETSYSRLADVRTVLRNMEPEVRRRSADAGVASSPPAVRVACAASTDAPYVITTPPPLHPRASQQRVNGVHTPPSVSVRPPLPPRKADSAADLPANEHRNTSSSDDGVYDLPRATAALSIYDSISPLSTPNVSTSPLTSTMSTTSLCSSSNDSRASNEMRQDYRRLSVVVPAPSMDYLDVEEGHYTSIRRSSEHIEARGVSQPLRPVSVSLTTVIEHVLFVEVGGRVWVAGWTQSLDQQLSCLFRIGDELVEVEDTPVNGMHNIPQLFYELSTPGRPMTIQIRPLPNAITVRLVKPIQASKPLGIVLHKEKNRIKEITEDSAAFRRGVPTSLVSFFDSERRSYSVITEVNHRRLNPFARNNAPLQRIAMLREGLEFSLTLQPHDFIKELKKQIRLVPHHKLFLCDTGR